MFQVRACATLISAGISDGVIVGIIDRAGGLINADGFSFDEIRDLFLTKNGNELNHPNMLSFEEVNTRIWDLKAEVFIPCAASRLITDNQLLSEYQNHSKSAL